MEAIGPVAFVSVAVATYMLLNKNKVQLSKMTTVPVKMEPISTYDALIGNTPLVHLQKLSELIGCDVYVKMESMNPSGTGKDRAVQSMLKTAMARGLLRPNVQIVEGTSGSTGIALAYQCNALNVPGLKVHIVMPDDQAEEKRKLLQKLGATVHITASCAISNKDHYVNKARKLVENFNMEGQNEDKNSKNVPTSAVFMDQFENIANYEAHYKGTGPELWSQLETMRGKIPPSTNAFCASSSSSSLSSSHTSSSSSSVTPPLMDAFVMSSGTGGTIAGISKYLKERDSRVKVILADPTGSSLLSKVKYNICYTPQQSERTIRRHRYDSIVEGVGLDRVTANFDQSVIDDGYLISDQEILDTARWLLRNEGLFVGSSSALNVAATVRTAWAMREEAKKQRKTDASSSTRRRPCLVTVICDNGHRHLSRLWNEEYVTSQYNLEWKSGTGEGVEVIPDCLKLFL